MLSDYSLPVFMSAGLITSAAIAFSLPPLTFSASEAEIDEVTAAEKSFCEQAFDHIDCRCYAQMSSYVISNGSPKVRGFRYADQQELARIQAESSC